MTVQESSSPLGEKLLEAQAMFAATSGTGAVGAIAEIWTDGILLKPMTGGRTLYVPFVELLAVGPSNYRISLPTLTSEMTLSQLGSRFDQFALKLVDSWGDSLERALLMHEPTMVYEARCNYSMRMGQGLEQPPSPVVACRARIYQTSLVILPSEGAPTRYPLSSVSSLDLENYKVKVASDERGVVTLSGLGSGTDLFFEKLVGAQKDLETDTIETIKSMLPSIGYNEINALAGLMAEGRAAMRKDVEKASPDAWRLLTKKVMESPLAEEFQHLSSSVSDVPEATAIGLKRSMDDVYVWFLVLVRGSAKDGGNALVMEITSEKGHATYLFRVMERGVDFASDPSTFQQAGEAMLHRLNEAMVATGFRREPIYLDDDMLVTAQYSKYLYASKTLPELILLRERFFARIIHTTLEAWKADLGDALAFNTGPSTGPSARWGKPESYSAPDDSV